MGEDGDTILSLKVLHIKSEILARKKINTTSCCVNHVYTSLKKIRIRFDFLRFRFFLASMLFGKDDEYEKMHTRISDSVRKDLNTYGNTCRIMHIV